MALFSPTKSHAPEAVQRKESGSEAKGKTQAPPSFNLDASPVQKKDSGTPQKGTITASMLNVRSGPGTDNPITGKPLPGGFTVSVLEIKGKWARIGDGRWLALKHLKLSEGGEKKAAEPEVKEQDAMLDGIAETVYHSINTVFFGTGWGTDENSIYDALGQLGKDQAKIDQLKQVYMKKYGRDLVTDIRGDFSDNIFFGDELSRALELLNLGKLANKKGTKKADKEEKPKEKKADKQEERWAEFSYESQRDNEYDKEKAFTKKISRISGDSMCNVTTLAMMLEQLSKDDDALRTAAAQLLLDKGYSGEKEVLAKMQLEDLLMMIFEQLGDQYFKDNCGVEPNGSYGPHQYAGCLNHVAEMFTGYVGKASHVGAVLTKEDYMGKIKPKMDDGAAVMLSSRLTGGHIVQLVQVMDDGLVINDPYGSKMPGGYVRNGDRVTRKSRFTKDPETFKTRFRENPGMLAEIEQTMGDPDAKIFGNSIGKFNFYPWAEVTKYKIGKWVNVVGKK